MRCSWRVPATGISLALLAGALAGCGRSDPAAARAGSPADALPAHVTRLLEAGLRPDWSHDGRHLLFLDDLVGNVFELDFESRNVRPLTSHFDHSGFTRARYLASGDILLCGPQPSDASRTEQGRWHTALWFLGADLSRPAVALDAPCFEGPAVSRRSLRIAWTQSDYPDAVLFGRSEIWIGDVAIEDGRPALVNRRKLLDRSDFFYLAFLETQDFRFPDERELIFTAYAYRGGEVMGVDLESREIRNYSKDWGYDEAEGVFPDGSFAAVEREPETYTLTPQGRIDIWRTALDGSARTMRLTHFSEFPDFGANNPVVSPDGRWMAFQLRDAAGPHGNGQGIFLLDLRAIPVPTDDR
jgi:hypothetical protein